MPDLSHQSDIAQDFYFVEAEEQDTGHVQKLLNLFVKGFTAQIWFFANSWCANSCVPMTRGLLGTSNLNVEMQRLLNPPTADNVEKFGWKFGVNDKAHANLK